MGSHTAARTRAPVSESQAMMITAASESGYAPALADVPSD
jgi:hypothetical protein